jgi:hypothetical protein
VQSEKTKISIIGDIFICEQELDKGTVVVDSKLELSDFKVCLCRSLAIAGGPG